MGDNSQLELQFQKASNKKQLELIPELVHQGEPGLTILQNFLKNNHRNNDNLGVMGAAYQALYQTDNSHIQSFLATNFPQGLVPLISAKGVDYYELYLALLTQDFQQADLITSEKMKEIAGPGAVKRKWLYFTEVEQFPIEDLKTIDRLWQVHSAGKFGFSVQRKIWLALGKNFDKFWPKIAWRAEGKWTRYPDEFIWDLSAPRGHLPLSNQLRGARVINALLNHPAWLEEV
jgi:hypothetical protein